VPIVPDFGIDKQFGTADTALHNFREDVANHAFIAVHRGAVKKAETGFSGMKHPLRNLFSGKAVRTKGSHADTGDGIAIR